MEDICIECKEFAKVCCSCDNALRFCLGCYLFVHKKKNQENHDPIIIDKIRKEITQKKI